MTLREVSLHSVSIGPAGFVLCGLTLLAGCSSSATPVAHDHGHEHDHRPASLDAAVKEVLVCRDAIRTAMENDKPDDAHDPLHEVGELIPLLPDLAAETDLPKEKWEALKTASERLMDAFGQIDKAFHQKEGDKKGAYENSAAEIDAAIQEIQTNVIVTDEADKPEEPAAVGEAS